MFIVGIVRGNVRRGNPICSSLNLNQKILSRSVAGRTKIFGGSPEGKRVEGIGEDSGRIQLTGRHYSAIS